MNRILPLALATAATGCQLPTIDIGTRQPIKIDPIDIKMRVDVYQHSGDEPDDVAKNAEYDAAIERMRNRMAELQNLKNNRAIGENHRGLLTIREVPQEFEAGYVKKVTEAENADRQFLMRRDAQQRDVLLSVVQKEQWQRRSASAHPEEWIEIENAGGENYRWVKKGS